MRGLAIALGICGLMTAGCGASSHGSSQTPAATPSLGSTPTTVPPEQSVLVFSTFQGTSETTVFMRVDGTIVQTVHSTNTDATFNLSVSNNNNYISYSSALLSSDELYPSGAGVQITKWAVFDKRGRSHRIPDSLTSFLNQILRDMGTHTAPGVFLTDPNTMYAVVAGSSGKEYDRVDLSSGQVATLFAVNELAAPTANWIQASDVAPSRATISFVVANATIQGQRVEGVSVAVLDLRSRSLAVHPLPAVISQALLPASANGGAWHGPGAFASADGRLVVYQTFSVENGTQLPHTHIYDLFARKDVTVDTSIPFAGGANSVFFSLDGSYAAMVSGDDQELLLIRTADGQVMKTFDTADVGGEPGSRRIVPMGWTSTGSLIYETSAAKPGNPEAVTAHSYDVSTHAAREYAFNLGELIAVLF